MPSLEKSMLFIPNRFHASGRELYVSFNIAVIPPDMNISSMKMCVPLPFLLYPAGLACREIAGGWDEQLIWTAQPPKGEAFLSLSVAPGIQEVYLDLSRFNDSWRFRSLENHGVAVELSDSGNPPFRLENPPYLIVTTL